MLKIIFATVILAIVSQPVYGDDVGDILGDFTSIAIFPPILKVPGTCTKYTIKRKTGTCSCGGVTDIPLLAMVIPEKFDQEFVPIIARNLAEVPSKLQYKDCTCGDEDGIRFVFMPVNDNYIIQYESLVSKDMSNESQLAILMARKIPTRAEFDSIIATLPDLKDRKYELLCNVY